MKIYIVTSGEYSDYGIVAVFQEKEKAEIYCATHNKGNCYEYCRVDEFETEDYKIESKEIPKCAWSFFEDKNGLRIYGGYLTFDKKERLGTDKHGAVHGTILIRKDVSEKRVRKVIADKVAKFKMGGNT